MQDSENALKSHLLDAGKKEVKSATGKEYSRLKGWITGGPIGLRVLSFLAGVGCILLSIFFSFGKVFVLNVPEVIVEIYCAIFGFFIVILEVKDVVCTKYLRTWLDKELHLFSKLSGRAYFYMFVGTLNMAQGWPFQEGIFPGILKTVIGALLISCSICSWIVARNTSASLLQLKKNVLADGGGDLTGVFNQFDADSDGALDTNEFLKLVDMSFDQLDAAVQVLDKDGTGKIEFSEFINWWAENPSL